KTFQNFKIGFTTQKPFQSPIKADQLALLHKYVPFITGLQYSLLYGEIIRSAYNIPEKNQYMYPAGSFAKDKSRL
ncbi:MAG: hypothetical protein H7832_14755, partial [Magnetococcus sp. DMHC-6]